MKLEMKHLAPYLPYGLKVSNIHFLNANAGIGNINQVISASNRGLKQYRPILRPLSDLPKQNGDDDNYNYLGIINFTHAFSLDGKEVGVLAMPYFFIEELFKEHYDVFGLIEKGLAVDINDVLADA